MASTFPDYQLDNYRKYYVSNTYIIYIFKIENSNNLSKLGHLTFKKNSLWNYYSKFSSGDTTNTPYSEKFYKHDNDQFLVLVYGENEGRLYNTITIKIGNKIYYEDIEKDQLFLKVYYEPIKDEKYLSNIEVYLK